MRYTVLAFCVALTACGASNIKALQDDPSGTIYAESSDSLPVTYQRVMRGMRACYNFPVRGDYVHGSEDANITVTASVGERIWLNAYLTPDVDGTQARIDYRMVTWKGKAETMQSLVAAKEPSC